MAPEVIDIMKPGGDKAKTQLRYEKDQQLHGSIPSCKTSPMVELEKIDSAGGGKDMPPPDASGSGIPTFAPDENTKAATETLEALQGQWIADLPENSSLSTPPGEADYFSGDGLMENVRQSHRRWKVHSAPVSQQSVPNTPAGSITTISVGIIPPARVVAEDLTKANLLPNLLQMALSGVGKQVTSESTDSRSAGGLGGTKSNQPSSSKPRASTMHSSEPGPSGGAAGGSG